MTLRNPRAGIICAHAAQPRTFPPPSLERPPALVLAEWRETRRACPPARLPASLPLNSAMCDRAPELPAARRTRGIPA